MITFYGVIIDSAKDVIGFLIEKDGQKMIIKEKTAEQWARIYGAKGAYYRESEIGGEIHIFLDVDEEVTAFTLCEQEAIKKYGDWKGHYAFPI